MKYQYIDYELIKQACIFARFDVNAFKMTIVSSNHTCRMSSEITTQRNLGRRIYVAINELLEFARSYRAIGLECYASSAEMISIDNSIFISRSGRIDANELEFCSEGSLNSIEIMLGEANLIALEINNEDHIDELTKMSLFSWKFTHICPMSKTPEGHNIFFRGQLNDKQKPFNQLKDANGSPLSINVKAGTDFVSLPPSKYMDVRISEMKSYTWINSFADVKVIPELPDNLRNAIININVYNNTNINNDNRVNYNASVHNTNVYNYGKSSVDDVTNRMHQMTIVRESESSSMVSSPVNLQTPMEIIRAFVKAKFVSSLGSAVLLESFKDEFILYANTSSLKFLQRNSIRSMLDEMDYIVKEANVCKFCMSLSKKGCCPNYSRGARTMRLVVYGIKRFQ